MSDQIETGRVHVGSCLDVLPTLPEKSVDLVFGSPPYEQRRTYGIGFNLAGEKWVEWMCDVVVASLRVSRGLVAFVVEGQTKNFRWSAAPVLLMADLHRRGVHLRKPPAFCRVGIAGSGGPDWLRNDYEFIVCCTSGGKLPWSANTALGHPPKWAPGGAMSHRLTNGERRNQWGASKRTSERKPNGKRTAIHESPSHVYATPESLPTGYKPPVLANPGNLIHCKVGGGQMGSRLCHKNEAPFPERLAEMFICSFCPPEGVVLDPFAGSGTTLAVAERHGRRWVGIDVRQEMADLCDERIAEVRNVRTA